MSSIPQRESLAEQVADLIRGSAGLREDIADELADHLASHAEESGIRDPKAAMDEAVQAFGDPKQVARELRAVHMGAEIMFQKIMIVVLLLVVCVMGAVMYFTLSTTRDITAQMASVSKQTGQQLEELGRKMGEFNAAQSVQQPSRLRIFCFSGSKEQPVAGCKVMVKSVDYADKDEVRGRTFLKEYTTDSSGRIDTGPVVRGTYELSGGWEPTVDGKVAGRGSWIRSVRLQQMGQAEEVSIEVPVTVQREVRLQGEVVKYWDTKRMPMVNLRIEGRSDMPNDCYFKWEVRLAIRASGTSVVTGFRPGGSVGGALWIPDPDQKGRSRLNLQLNGFEGSIEVPQDGGPVTIVVNSQRNRPSGTLRLDDKGTPAPGVPIEIGDDNGLSECLITDDQGHFESTHGGQSSRPVRILWHTSDGQDGVFEYQADPYCPCQIDLSKLETLRSQFVSVEKLKSLIPGFELPFTARIKWSRKTEVGETCATPDVGHTVREVVLDSSKTVNLLVLAGEYTVTVGGVYTARGSSSLVREEGHLQTEVRPNEVRTLRVDVEKLVVGTPRARPGRPAPPDVSGKVQENPAITVVGAATTQGSGELRREN